MNDVLVKRGNLDTDMHPGRTACEDEGRDQSNAVEAKESQRLPINHQKGSRKEKHGKDSFLQTSEHCFLIETNPPDTSDIRQEVSRTVRQQFSVI